MKRIFVVFLVFSLLNNVFADCSRSATKLAKGQKAPCAGILLGMEKEAELRKERQKAKITLEDLAIKNEMIKVYKKDIKDVEEIVEKSRQQTEVWRKRAIDSTTKLVSEKRDRGNRDWMFFVLGILTTGVAAYAVGQASK